VTRPTIAFFDYPDVFEDFYPHYGVDQDAFATRWAGTGNHAFARALQDEVGDVVWYGMSLAPELREARHEVTGCRVRMVRSSAAHRALWRSFYLSKAAWRLRPAYPAYAVAASYLAPLSRELARALRRDRPDVIFSQDYASGRYDVLVALGRALGTPVVAYHSGSFPDGYVGRAAKRWTLRAADRLLASSPAERDMLVDRFGVDRARVSVVLTPIDTQTYRPRDRAACARAHGLDPARRAVVFAGRLDDPVKRVSAIVRAFAEIAARHPDVDLVLAGSGPDGEAIAALADELAPGRVRRLGWVEGGEPLADLLGAAECVVLASRSEGFPTVVGEALACGTPVVATRVGAVPELVVDGVTGRLVEPGDDRALAEALDAVLRDPGGVDAMRPQARRLAEERVAHAAVGRRLRELVPVRAR